jgi:hypothetical protein
MESKTITVNVLPEAARIYDSASPEEKRKLELLLSLELMWGKRDRRSLKEIMAEAGRQAQENGLTPEMLEDILNER